MLLVSDPHWTMRTNDAYRFEIFPTVLELIKKDPSITDICIAGDLTEHKDNHSALLVNKIVDGILSWEAAILGNVYILMGNHDIAADEPFFRFLGAYPSVLY